MAGTRRLEALPREILTRRLCQLRCFKKWIPRVAQERLMKAVTSPVALVEASWSTPGLWMKGALPRFPPSQVPFPARRTCVQSKTPVLRFVNRFVRRF
jgi:hypothetical protein